MNLCGWHLVELFCTKHPQAKPVFDDWRAKVLDADPQKSDDFKVQIGHKPDFLTRSIIVFDINSHRVVCSWGGSQYRDQHGNQVLLVDPLFPMIHKDYEKWSRKMNY